MKMDRLAPFQLFVAAAEAGSFSAAARRLDLGPVQASATIARLERELAVRLFERSTRRLRLTPKPDSDLADDFKWLEIDVGLADGLPAQVITLGATGSTAQVTDFRSVKLNVEVPAKAFELEPIKLSEWNSVYEDLNEPSTPRR